MTLLELGIYSAPKIISRKFTIVWTNQSKHFVVVTQMTKTRLYSKLIIFLEDFIFKTAPEETTCRELKLGPVSHHVQRP